MKITLIILIKMIMILILTICRSNSLIRNLNGTEFSDNFIFISMNVLGISYTYKFENDNYTILAKSNQGRSNNFEEFEVENGNYSLKKNELILYPKTKLCINIGVKDGNELIWPYKFSISDEGVFYVNIDTLLGTEINHLRFIPRSITIKKIEGKIGFKDAEITTFSYFKMKN